MKVFKILGIHPISLLLNVIIFYPIQDRETIYSLALDKVLSKNDSDKSLYSYPTIPEYISDYVGESVTKREECMLEMNDKTFTLYHVSFKLMLARWRYHNPYWQISGA